MFVFPGNMGLCFTDDVPISVNPGLSSAAGTGLFHLTFVLEISVIVCFDLLASTKPDFNKIFFENKSESEL